MKRTDMMWIRNVICFLGSVLLFSACTENADVSVENYTLDSKLTTYYESFVTEAADRGVDISDVVYQISGSIETIDEGKVVAQCIKTTEYHSIKIDQKTWNASSDLKREFLVFHELGHCALGRDHDDTMDANGQCTSMMQSGLSECDMDYNTDNRENYLDELFFKN